MPRGQGGVTLETHRGLEAIIGLALLLVPFLLRYGLPDGVDFSNASIYVCAVIGAVAATLGFAGDRSTRDPSGGSHATFDRLLGVALVVATLVFASRGELEATLLLGASAAGYAALILFTRYGDRA